MQSNLSREGEANPLVWRRAVPFQPDASCREYHLKIQFRKKSSQRDLPEIPNAEPEEGVYQGAVDVSCEDSVLINSQTGTVLLAKNFYTRTYRQVTVESFTELLTVLHPTAQILTQCLYCSMWHHCECFASDKIDCIKRVWSRGSRRGPAVQSVRRKLCISCQKRHTCRSSDNPRVCVAATFRLRRFAVPKYLDQRYLLAKKQRIEKEIKDIQISNLKRK